MRCQQNIHPRLSNLCWNAVLVMRNKWYMLKCWISIVDVVRIETFFDKSGTISWNIFISTQTEMRQYEQLWLFSCIRSNIEKHSLTLYSKNIKKLYFKYQFKLTPVEPKGGCKDEIVQVNSPIQKHVKEILHYYLQPWVSTAQKILKRKPLVQL